MVFGLEQSPRTTRHLRTGNVTNTWEELHPHEIAAARGEQGILIRVGD